jgi:hypothetical protein
MTAVDKRDKAPDSFYYRVDISANVRFDVPTYR